MNQNTQNNKEQNIIKNIMQVAPKHCENCGHKYTADDFQIMKTTAVNTLLHLKCSNCGNTYMLNVVSPMQGMVGSSRVPMNLDLESVDEINKFVGKNPTQLDEAIDIYDTTSPESFKDFFDNMHKNKSKKDTKI